MAPLGTALTEDQIQEAWKVVNEPICCFDGDAAGIRAAVRSVDRVLPILRPGYSLQYAFLPDKQDPDEFLKAKGTEEFLKVVTTTVPLKDLLWRKNLEGKLIDTPEQKARIEKDIKEEVAKIADETVRGYYVQEMKRKIYSDLVEPSRPARKGKVFAPRSFSSVHRARTDLDDLVARYVISAFVCYPQLAEEYEERLFNFAVKDNQLKELYDAIVEVVQGDFAPDDEEKLAAVLDSRPNLTGWRRLVDVHILKKQCPDIIKMRKDLDERLVEVQLRQLETDIRESKRVLENGDFSSDDYKRYEMLKKERDLLLKENDGF